MKKTYEYENKTITSDVEKITDIELAKLINKTINENIKFKVIVNLKNYEEFSKLVTIRNFFIPKKGIKNFYIIKY